ncbi:MAG: proton-conducting transporter membrane subunit [Bacteroidota bacterium]
MNLLIYFLSVLALALVVFFIRNKTVHLFVSFIFVVVQFTLNYFIFNYRDEFTNSFFRPDALAVLFISVLSITGITTFINSFIYFKHRNEHKLTRSVYLASMILLFGCMTGAFLSDNINILWILAEATTLCISMLIYHERTQESLEATWKYFFVSTIGLSLSFIGILLLNAATSSSGFDNLTFSSLMSEKLAITNPMLFQVSFLLILIGFSVKMGIFPLHTVCIDAHSVAPGPVSAIISTSLMNVGFVAVFRFYQLFAHTYLLNWISHVMLIIGLLSILVATVYMLKVKNYKRLIAYSSIEHMGLITIGIAIGGIAYYAIVLHLVIHSFTKAGLFYQAQQFVRIFNSKRTEHTGGYFRITPLGGIIVILLFIVIMGIPPSGLFFTKLMMLQALISTNHLEIAIFILLLLAFVLWTFGNNIFHILFADRKVNEAPITAKVSFWESMPQLFLLLLALYISIYPPEILTNTIHEVIQNLPK